MAVAPIDEDDDENVLKLLDAPAGSIQDLETAKGRIGALLEDQQRKTDYQNRLEKKLLTLDTALSQQRDEVESLQRTLELEKRKDNADEESRRTERLQKTRKQEERIRNDLSDVLYRKLPPRPGKKNQVFELDTVLISFIRPNDNIRYNLPFRVDKETTLKQLRDDACKYWDVSTEDFILKTMGNSKCQNEILVNQCFKQGEIAQLRLEFKNKEQTSVTEAEYKAIAPRNNRGRGRSNKKADMGVDTVLKFADKYASSLKKMGGVYFLLKLRDSKPSEHCNKIKPRDIFIYAFLAVLTVFIYSAQNPSGEKYWLLQGASSIIGVSVPKISSDANAQTSASVPAFTEIKTYDDVWDWLEYSLPHVLWRNGTSTDQHIATYNMLVGYVNIRHKTLAAPNPAHAHCDRFKGTIESLTGAVCPKMFIDKENEQVCSGIECIGTGNSDHYAGIQRDWEFKRSDQKDTDFIRGPANPYDFVSAEDNSKKHGIGKVHGHLQVYDAGGYSAEYKAAVPELVQAENVEFYRKDMAYLRVKNWIDKLHTRAVFISMSFYNYHYDMWVALDLTLELPPSGLVVPSYEIRPFIPNLFETSTEYAITYILFFRLIIAGYIVVVVGLNEMSHKTKNQKAGYQYYISPNGICDVVISVCIIASIVTRFARFSNKRTSEEILLLTDVDKSYGYKSYSDLARDYEWLFIMEGIIFSAAMFRMVTLFRINRTVYLLWHTLGKTMKQGLYLCLLFVPTFWFFTMCGHSIWGSKLENFRTLSRSFITVFHMTRGSFNIADLVSMDTVMAVGYYLLLYIFVTFLLVTGFATVFIEAYYVVHLTSFSSGEAFSAERWKNWFIHPALLSCFHYAMTGSVSSSDKEQFGE
jgi:hypothetical protein